MNFILFLKTDFQYINLDAILDINAPTYSCHSYQVNDFHSATLVTYTYDTPLNTQFVKLDNDTLHIVKGCAVSKTQYSIQEILENVTSKIEKEIDGDYLILKLNNSGHGHIIRPLSSLHQLFYYEYFGVQIIATDLSLILKSVKQLSQQQLKENFDYGFIYESIFNEWGARVCPNRTLIKQIKRVDPTDSLKITNFNLSIDLHSDDLLAIDPEFETLFQNNKDLFYEKLMRDISDTNRLILKKTALKSFKMNITGGLDSRVCLSILNNFKEELHLEINPFTGGPSDHPDVEIGKMIADTLGLKHTHAFDPNVKSQIPNSLEDYKQCFLCSMGDWNSNNYAVFKYRPEVEVFGQNNYKKSSYSSLYVLNRWVAARTNSMVVLPILHIRPVNQFILLTIKYNCPKEYYRFVYEALRYFSPNLLDIPFVGMTLPLYPIPAHKTVGESKAMPHILAEAFFDEKVIENNLLLFQSSNIANKIDISDLNTERKKRIAMDFASIATHCFSSDEYLSSLSSEVLIPLIKYQNKADQLIEIELIESNLLIENKNQNINSNIWYIFGQLSKKRKLQTIARVLSKKTGIYPLLKPLRTLFSKRLAKHVVD